MAEQRFIIIVRLTRLRREYVCEAGATLSQKLKKNMRIHTIQRYQIFAFLPKQ